MTWMIGLSIFGLILYRELSGNAMLLNEHSIVMVVGGTIATVFLLASKSAIIDLVKMTSSIFKDEKKITDLTLKSIIENPQNVDADYMGLVSYAKDIWLVGVEREEFEQLLTFRAQTIINQHMSAISVLRNLGKYPPALGMIGTVLGMIGLFKGLSGGASNQIGSQLAVAMTATFYGLILSNLFLLPLADRLEAKEEERRGNLEQIINVLITIHQKQPKSIAEGILNVA